MTCKVLVYQVSRLVIEKPNINVSPENIIHAIFTVELLLLPELIVCSVIIGVS